MTKDADIFSFGVILWVSGPDINILWFVSIMCACVHRGKAFSPFMCTCVQLCAHAVCVLAFARGKGTLKHFRVIQLGMALTIASTK